MDGRDDRAGRASPGAEYVAAVDLGSNSFHSLIGRVEAGGLRRLDKVRDPVRLAEGIRPDGGVEEVVARRALASLERIGERIAGIDRRRVRALGTNSFRRMRRAEPFLRRARAALGVPIEILSGAEEARLIYLGVSHGLPAIEGRTLVVDIGGGSTECILGRGFRPEVFTSFEVGCVAWTRRFFPDALQSKGRFDAAVLAARLELEGRAARFAGKGFERCVGSSGTIKSAARLVQRIGGEQEAITREGLRVLRDAFLAGRAPALASEAGVAADRLEVLPGGLCVLMAVFEILGIQSMRPVRAALREGALYDLLGRLEDEDVRERTVREMGHRTGIDLRQAQRVEGTALHLWEQVREAWQLEREEARRLLSFAARLYEIGLSVSYAGHQRHARYLLRHSDMPGFSEQDKERLATLVGAHRGRYTPAGFEALGRGWGRRTGALALLLRLAVRLHRSRRAEPLPAFEVRVADRRLELAFPPGWLAGHPLLSADLEEEIISFEAAGYRLEVR